MPVPLEGRQSVGFVQHKSAILVPNMSSTFLGVLQQIYKEHFLPPHIK